MSVCVYFKTAKQLKAENVLKSFAERGEKIMVTSQDFPCLKIGTFQEALRGIEINQEDDGYELRVCSFTNRADLKLFIVAIELMRAITGVKALSEDEEEIANPRDVFDEDWIKDQLNSSVSVTCSLIQHFGKPIIMYGLFFPICFGPVLAKSFDIDLSNPQEDTFESLQEYLTNLQWHFANKENTSTRLAIPDPTNENDRPLGVSVICAEDGKVSPFDLVSYAEVLGLVDYDGDAVMIHMEDFPRIVRSEQFTMLDDYQFAIDGQLSYEDFKQMQNLARLYQVDDLFYRPQFPGDGGDDRQNTFVLMWNPAISSVKMEDFVNDIPDLLTGVFNWSVYEYEKAKKGDKFVLIRCGEGRTGLVMSGIFASNPYQSEDWSGKGRKVFYMDLTPNFIADPEKLDHFITTEDLQKAISSFDWTGGHSGRLLTEGQAVQLEELLADYLPQFCNNVDGITVNGFSLPQGNE